MNAQHIISQISDQILQSDASNGIGKASNPKNKPAPQMSDLISLSLENDVSPERISSEALDKPMHDVVSRFKNDDYAFMEMISKAIITGDARDMLADRVDETESLTKGTMLLATVEGEYHRHGKDIIYLLSRGIGLDTIDLGMGISTGEILEAVDEHRPDYLGLSASTRATIPDIEELVGNVHAVKDAEKTKVVLGGFLAIDTEANAIDADYRCPNIHQSIDLLLRLANSPN